MSYHSWCPLLHHTEISHNYFVIVVVSIIIIRVVVADVSIFDIVNNHWVLYSSSEWKVITVFIHCFCLSLGLLFPYRLFPWSSLFLHHSLSHFLLFLFRGTDNYPRTFVLSLLIYRLFLQHVFDVYFWIQANTGSVNSLHFYKGVWSISISYL